MNIDPTTSRLAAEGVAYAPEITGAARRHGLDPELLAAVAAQETGGPGSNSGHNVVGDGGHGHGLFQIDDRWHAFARTPDAMEPGRNADYAAAMISGLLARYKGNVHAALSAYNSGSPTATGTKTRWQDGRDLGYADSVLAHAARLGAGGSPQPLAPLPPAQAPPPPDSSTDPRDAAIAELGSLIASLGVLASQAQNFPAFPAAPSLGQPPTPYRQQVIDYGALLDNDDDTRSAT
jgi:hypothetical protein